MFVYTPQDVVGLALLAFVALFALGYWACALFHKACFAVRGAFRGRA